MVEVDERFLGRRCVEFDPGAVDRGRRRPDRRVVGVCVVGPVDELAGESDVGRDQFESAFAQAIRTSSEGRDFDRFGVV